MRVVQALSALCLVGIMGCAVAPSGWDLQGAESLKQMSAKVLRDIDSGNFQGMFAEADSNLVVMDFDENNAPMRLDGTAGAAAFIARMTDLTKTQGLKFTSTMVRNEAWATATMGYSIIEYDQTISAGGQAMGPFKFRGTLIARRDGSQWKMTHWHGSFRETPPPMPAPDSTTAQ